MARIKGLWRDFWRRALYDGFDSGWGAFLACVLMMLMCLAYVAAFLGAAWLVVNGPAWAVWVAPVVFFLLFCWLMSRGMVKKGKE